MTFTSLTVLNDNEIDITFTGDDGTTVTHRFTIKDVGEIAVINGDRDFGSKYRRVPGPGGIPRWPEPLVSAARAAYRQPFPAGQALERMRAEMEAHLEQRWNEAQAARADQTEEQR